MNIQLIHRGKVENGGIYSLLKEYILKEEGSWFVLSLGGTSKTCYFSHISNVYISVI